MRLGDFEYVFSLDTARDPADMIHDDDGQDALSTSDDRSEYPYMAWVCVRTYHGGRIRKVQSVTFQTFARDLRDALAQLGRDAHLLGITESVEWSKVYAASGHAYRAQFEQPCYTTGCPDRWHVDALASFLPVLDDDADEEPQL